jgi:hypothetical protein
MRDQTIIDVHNSITLTLSMLHHNNVGVTYPGTSNLRMEPVRFVPLYYVAML